MEEITMGKRIMTLRKEKGLTQEQLAERLNVSPQAVSKWENDVSCPDISIIPQLAEVLGISTDELLGVKPVEPHVVVVEGGKEKKKKDGFTFEYNAGKRGGIFFAILLVLLGVAFLLSRTVFINSGVDFWGVCWPALLILLGIQWSIEHVSPLSVGVALFGLYYLLFNIGIITFAINWSIIWPVALILLGLTILCDALFKKRHHGKCGHYFHVDGDHQSRSSFDCENGFVRSDCAFTEDHHAVTEEFIGGDIDLSFGKGSLDLSACPAVRPGATLKVDVSFGSYEIILPRTIRIDADVDKAFGSMNVTGRPNENAPYSIILSGDAAFGSLEVRYL